MKNIGKIVNRQEIMERNNIFAVNEGGRNLKYANKPFLDCCKE